MSNTLLPFYAKRHKHTRTTRPSRLARASSSSLSLPFGSLGSEAVAFVRWLHKRQSGKLPPTLLEAASWACPQLGPFVRQAVGVAVRRGLAHAVNATRVHVPPPPPPVAPVARASTPDPLDGCRSRWWDGNSELAVSVGRRPRGLGCAWGPWCNVYPDRV